MSIQRRESGAWVGVDAAVRLGGAWVPLNGSAVGPVGPTQTASYTEDTSTDFPNPDRGWYSEGNSEGSTFYPRPTGGDWATHQLYAPAQALTSSRLAMKYVRLDNYRTQSLGSTYLAAHAAELASFRGTGRKAVLRYAYNRLAGTADASISRVLGHISELGPLWNTYQDVISVLQMGFIGHWGEWGAGTSSNNLLAGSDSNGLFHQQIMQAVLDATPAGMMVQFRYPNLVGPNDAPNANYPGFYTSALPRANRFNGSHQARTGLYNDCYLDGSYNGAWWDPWDGTTTSGDYAITDNINPVTAMGGETCRTGGRNSYNEGPGAVATMARTAIDYLHSAYHEDKLDMWAATAFPGGGNYLQHISRRLGYRLVLRNATVPSAVSAGGSMSVTLGIENVGFGKVYNPRPIDLVFVGSNGTFTTRLTNDARRDLPLGGETETMTFTANAPSGLQAGVTYALYLRLPDPSGNLAANNLYAIRLANTGIWDGSTGRHSLGLSIVAS